MCSQIIVFFNDKIFAKVSDNFWCTKLTLKVRILQFSTTFTQVYTRPKQNLLGSSLAFTPNEGLVRCAKVHNKSWVILIPTVPIYSVGPGSKLQQRFSNNDDITSGEEIVPQPNETRPCLTLDLKHLPSESTHFYLGPSFMPGL